MEEEEEFDLKHFETFLSESKSEGGHWDKIKKRTATLFQVLIDGDLKELVFVLKHYPQYTELVCEHFRYLYNYSEQSADIFAASKLLYLSEAYHQKQFVRNLLRKLEKIETHELSQIKTLILFLVEHQERLHPIIISYYKAEIVAHLKSGNYHLLQQKIIEKELLKLHVKSDFDFGAKDRDASLDIPYMV